jgi:hypothetical protein
MSERSGNPYLDDAIDEVLRGLDEDTRNSIEITRIARD